MTTTPNPADCICRPDQNPGTYTVGCRYHMDLELQRGPSATPKVEAFTVTYWRGAAKVHTPIERDGVIWSQETRFGCPHRHDSPEAAERCSKRLARQHGTVR